jgi:hypothetical protein
MQLTNRRYLPVRSNTPISIAQDFYDKYQQHLCLTQKKDKFSFSGSAVKSFKTVKDCLPRPLPFDTSDKQIFLEFQNKVVELLKENSTANLDDDLKSTVIVMDILTAQKFVTEEGGVKPYSFDAFKDSVEEEQFSMLYAQREHAIVSFNPNKPLSWNDEIDTTTGPEEFKHYNTYVRPRWAYHKSPDSYPLCEDFVRPFLDIFIPGEDEKNYVIYWLNCLKYQRNNDVLVLIGTQGNGKNTLMQLATVIAGRHNTIIGSKAFGRDKFNGEVLKRKLVNLDEYCIKGNAKESLKCFSNDDVTVEIKGRDPVQIQNHCSFIVANNSMRSTDIEFKDRRFTCPTLNKKDLLLHWPKDRIAAFKSSMKTLTFEIEFSNWLAKEVREKGLNYPNQMNYITPHFYNIVEASKPEWFKEFKRQLLYKESVNTQDVYKSTRVRVSDSKLQEELAKEIEEREFRNIKPHAIAKVITQEGKTQYISKIYKGDSGEESQDSDILAEKV